MKFFGKVFTILVGLCIFHSAFVINISGQEIQSQYERTLNRIGFSKRDLNFLIKNFDAYVDSFNKEDLKRQLKLIIDILSSKKTSPTIERLKMMASNKLDSLGVISIPEDKRELQELNEQRQKLETQDVETKKLYDKPIKQLEDKITEEQVNSNKIQEDLKTAKVTEGRLTPDEAKLRASNLYDALKDYLSASASGLTGLLINQIQDANINYNLEEISSDNLKNPITYFVFLITQGKMLNKKIEIDQMGKIKIIVDIRQPDSDIIKVLDEMLKKADEEHRSLSLQESLDIEIQNFSKSNFEFIKTIAKYIDINDKNTQIILNFVDKFHSALDTNIDISQNIDTIYDIFYELYPKLKQDGKNYILNKFLLESNKEAIERMTEDFIDTIISGGDVNINAKLNQATIFVSFANKLRDSILANTASKNDFYNDFYIMEKMIDKSGTKLEEEFQGKTALYILGYRIPLEYLTQNLKKIIFSLLTKGVNPNPTTEDVVSILIHFADNYRKILDGKMDKISGLDERKKYVVEILKALITQQNMDVNAKSKIGNTSIYILSSIDPYKIDSETVEIAKLLVKKNADLKPEDKENKTAVLNLIENSFEKFSEQIITSVPGYMLGYFGGAVDLPPKSNIDLITILTGKDLFDSNLLISILNKFATESVKISTHLTNERQTKEIQNKAFTYFFKYSLDVINSILENINFEKGGNDATNILNNLYNKFASLSKSNKGIIGVNNINDLIRKLQVKGANINQANYINQEMHAPIMYYLLDREFVQIENDLLASSLQNLIDLGATPNENILIGKEEQIPLSIFFANRIFNNYQSAKMVGDPVLEIFKILIEKSNKDIKIEIFEKLLDLDLDQTKFNISNQFDSNLLEILTKNIDSLNFEGVKTKSSPLLFIVKLINNARDAGNNIDPKGLTILSNIIEKTNANDLSIDQVNKIIEFIASTDIETEYIDEIIEKFAKNNLENAKAIAYNSILEFIIKKRIGNFEGYNLDNMKTTLNSYLKQPEKPTLSLSNLPYAFYMGTKDKDGRDKLIEFFSNQKDSDINKAKDEFGRTPLMYAVGLNLPKIVDKLLNKKIDILAQDNFNFDALAWMALSCESKVFLNKLLTKVAETEFSAQKYYKSENLKMKIKVILANRLSKILKSLIEDNLINSDKNSCQMLNDLKGEGVNLDLVDESETMINPSLTTLVWLKNGDVPYQKSWHSWKFKSFIEENRGKINFKTKDFLGKNYLMLALENIPQDGIGLIGRKAYPKDYLDVLLNNSSGNLVVDNSLDARNRNVIHYAVNNTNVDALKYLLEKANENEITTLLNQKDLSGKTPVEMALDLYIDAKENAEGATIVAAGFRTLAKRVEEILQVLLSNKVK